MPHHAIKKRGIPTSKQIRTLAFDTRQGNFFLGGVGGGVGMKSERLETRTGNVEGRARVGDTLCISGAACLQVSNGLTVNQAYLAN